MRRDEIDSFVTFCQKRTEAHYNKEAGKPRPWSDDPIIATRRFTNVYRDLDHGSRWFFDQVDNEKLVFGELMMVVCTYRWVNWVPTFEEVGLPNFMSHAMIDEWCDRVDERHARGERIVTTRHNAFWKGTRERMHALTDLTDYEFAQRLWGCQTGEELVEVLQEINGLGPFTAVQVAADLMTIKWTAWSADTILPLAIGSRFGLHILREGSAPDKAAKSKLQRQKGLTGFEKADLDYLRAACEAAGMPHHRPLNYIDLEHALCEWFRYRAFQLGAPAKLTKYEPSS